MREYRRALALYCMASQPGTPFTAGDLAEMMGCMAQGEGHPVACWRGVNAGEVSGILRGLESSALARREGRQHNGRHGRTEPTWMLTDVAARYALPLPPSISASAPAPPPQPVTADGFEAMSRQQLYTLLRFHDEHAGAMARFFRDIAEINERCRRQLADHGLELPR